jgi:REP element-mobilizing transposase RayT
MSRKPRVEKEGFHHIINRGVARGNIFLQDEDYKKILEIIEIAKERYDFTLHSICLMRNHYHLLIETKHRNLSLLIRQINSPYAQYFNKKYVRVGPLWQGRFKNWFVCDDIYLSSLFKYIEQNPIKAKITKTIGEYPWASSTMILNNKYIDLLEESLLLKKEFWSILYNEFTEKDNLLLNELQKIVYQKREDELIKLKQRSLDEILGNYKNLKDRNIKILEAITDGYKQREIAEYLRLTSGGISYIVNK